MLTPLGFRLIVRFKRKPIWFPTAPSKLFRINDYSFYSEDEAAQIRLLITAYNHQKESIKQFMDTEFYIPATKAGGLPAKFVEQEEERDKILGHKNDIKNEEISRQKAAHFEQQIKRLENKLVEEKFNRESQILSKSCAVDEFIAKTGSDNFVTEENFESMVEEAMNNPSRHEFFISPSGKINRPAG